MRKQAVRACVVLVALGCLLLTGHAGLSWWARRVALEHREEGFVPTTCSAYLSRTGWQHQTQLKIALAEWRAIPWYGATFKWRDLSSSGQYSSYWRWVPARAHYEMLKLITGQDLGNDPSAWEAWSGLHPDLVWVDGLFRFVGSSEVPPLLKHPDAKVRLGALMGLKETNQRQYAGQVALMLDDPDPWGYVNSKAMWILASWGEVSAAPHILKRLDDPRPLVSVVSANTLASMGYRPAVPAIAALLEDGPTRVQVQDVKDAMAHAVGILSGEIRGEMDPYSVQQVRSWWDRHRQDPEWQGIKP